MKVIKKIFDRSVGFVVGVITALAALTIATMGLFVVTASSELTRRSEHQHYKSYSDYFKKRAG